MCGDAGSGGFSQIDTDIEAVRVVEFAQDAFDALAEIHHFMGFRGLQLLQLVSVPKWNDHDMAGGIRVSIEDDEAVPAAVDNAGFMVVTEL